MTNMDFIYMDVINESDRFHKHSRAMVGFTLFVVKIILAETIFLLLK